MTLAEQAAADAQDASETAPAMSLAKRAALDAGTQHAAASNQSSSPLGSDLENFAAGTGKAVADVGRGAGQLIRSGLSALGGSGVADQLGLPTRADIDESRRLDAPLMATKAGMGGNVLGNVATTMLPFAGAARAGVVSAAALANPATYGAAASAGAINGLLQPVGEGDNRAQNVGVGALTGMGGNLATNIVGRVAQPVTNALPALYQRAVATLQGAGVPLDAAQSSGSAALNSMKSSFYDNPFTRGAQQDAARGQQQAFNRATLALIGEHGADAATSDVMGHAATRINNVFHDVLSRNDVAINGPIINRVAAIQQAANDEERAPISNLANRLIGMVDQNGTAPGQQVYNLKKDLDRLASSPDTTLAYHARQLRTTVMDAINDSLPTADRATFQQARAQFGNMKKIEPAIDKTGQGDISPSVLANVMGQKANRQNSIYGRGNQDLTELAQAGKLLLGDKMPNSGTAGRAAMQIALPAIVGSIAGGSSYGSDEDTGAAIRNALLATGATVMAPRLAQRAINSPAIGGYLTKGMQSPMLRDLLLSPQNNQITGGLLRRLPGASVQANQPLPQQ